MLNTIVTKCGEIRGTTCPWDGVIAYKGVVAYGTQDKVQPFLASLRLKAALEESGVDYKYFELPHSGHGLQNDNDIQRQWTETISEYLDRYMPVGTGERK